MSNEESWDEKEQTAVTQQQPTAPQTRTLGIGRGKPRPETNDEDSSPQPQPISKWNGGNSGASAGFSNFRSNNNDENTNPNNGGGFGSRNSGANSGFGARSGGDGGGRGGFRNTNGGSNSSGDSRTCYNCNKPGHVSRECPEPRSYNGGGGGGGRSGGSSFNNNRGGYNSGGGDRNTNYESTSNGGNSSTFGAPRNSRNQYDGDQDDNNDRKPNTTWRTNNASNGNDGEYSNDRSTFNNSGARGGFRGGRGDRGGRGFHSGDRDNNGGDNRQNSNKYGNQSRDNGGNGFFSAGGGGGGRNNRASDDIFDQPGGRSGAQPIERYVPPPPPTEEEDIFGQALEKGENFDKYHRAQVKCTPDDKVKPIDLYDEANLGTQVLSNIRRAGFEEPTPIQRFTLPAIRQQEDIMACAQTGSGKTAAFLLPIISNLLEYDADELAVKHNPPSPLCLIVSPTRELALQTEREARKFAFQTAIIPCSAVGGHDMFTVSDRLREGCHILSATTGRLKDMVEKGRISLTKVKYFVLDEADRMLDTGFEPDIRKLEELGLPSKDERFTSMFSATFPEEVQGLAKYFLRDNYIFLVVGTPGGANEDITQTIEEVPFPDKKDRLFQLLEQNLKNERCLIFVETKRSADYIGSLLSQKKFMSTTMHGDRTQKQRYEAVQQFTNGKCPILVATSVAARGLDFPLIGYVINFDLPDTSDFYIHRIGRTGRAGHLGKSISFFDPERESDRKIAPELIAQLTDAGQTVPEFLQKYSDPGYGRGYTGHTTDVRSGRTGFGSRNQHASAPSGGNAGAGAAQADEHWD